MQTSLFKENYFVYLDSKEVPGNCCEQYWPNTIGEIKDYGHMRIEYTSNLTIPGSKNQPLDDVFRRKFELSNAKEGNYVYYSNVHFIFAKKIILK